jgi:IS5 family transposase
MPRNGPSDGRPSGQRHETDHRQYNGPAQGNHLFVTHIDALHGNPHDGHTLKAAVAAGDAWSGVTVEKVYVDKGYRGHGMDRFMVWRSG